MDTGPGERLAINLNGALARDRTEAHECEYQMRAPTPRATLAPAANRGCANGSAWRTGAARGRLRQAQSAQRALV